MRQATTPSSRLLTPSVIAAMLLASLLAIPSALAGLADSVRTTIRSADLGAATVGVSIRDADSSEMLYEHNADTAFVPASNMKLLTSGAALHTLGADFHFQTRLLRDGDRLIVLGDGDPAFGDPELLELMPVAEDVGMDVETFLDLWIDPIIDTGIESFSEVVVDDRIFDRQFVEASWPIDQLNRRYCAQVSGLSFHLNVLHFFPKPVSGATPSLNLIRPSLGWLSPVNNATSRMSANDKSNIWIARKRGTNKLTLYGNVKHAYRTPVPVTVHDMPALFARLLAERLERHDRTVAQHRVSAPDDPPSTGDVVGPVISTPISTVVTRCNRDSQNLYAECLLKRIGHEMTGRPGSWTDGAAIVRHIIRQRLESPSFVEGLAIVDGSGLSRNNRIPPGTLSAWLASMHQDAALSDVFVDSLAVAGASGTLRKRFRNVELFGASVQAKSGYINGVSCLSGYVTAEDGRRVAFSIMANDLSSTAVPKAKRMQERVVSLIADHLATRAVTLGSD